MERLPTGRVAGLRRSRLPAFLWLFTALFIVYGTTIPFHFVSDRSTVETNASRIVLNPLISPDTGRRVSISDVVQNILLFCPFGFFGVMALGRPRARLWRSLLVIALAALLSAVVETLQLLTIDRITSTADVTANTLGALVGVSAAIGGARFFDTSLTRLRASGVTGVPAFYPVMIGLIVVCVAAWEPFDVTLELGSVWSKLKALRVDPWQAGIPTDEGVAFLRYAMFSLAVSLYLRQLGVRSPGAAGMIPSACLGVALEGSQLFIAARMPGLEDALVNVAGAMGGAVVYARLPRVRSHALLCAALAGATAAAVAVQQLSPFTLSPVYRGFAWMPFRSYYEFTSALTLSHSFEALLMYFPLGFVLPLVMKRSWQAESVAILVALTIACPIEYLQGWVVGRYPDVTDPGLAVFGCWLGALAGGKGWMRFRAHLSALTERLNASNG